MKSFLLILLFFISSKMNSQNKIESVETVNIFNRDYSKLNDSIKIIEVAFEELLESPEKYAKKYVRVSGFLHLDLPFSVFYKSEEDYIKNEKLNAMVFLMHKEDTYAMSLRFNNKYAIVSGVFVLLSQNDLNIGIYQIQRVDAVKLK